MSGAGSTRTGTRARRPRRPREGRNGVVRLLPDRRFLRNGLVAVAIVTSLVFGALYWVTAPHQSWPALLVAHLAVLLATAVLAVVYLRAGITVSADEVRVFGCFHATRRIRRDDIAAITTMNVFRSVTMDSLPHLYVSGPHERVLLRMRGEFWAREDMDRVAAVLRIRPTPVADPLALAELRANYDALVPWWQRDLRQLLRRRTRGER